MAFKKWISLTATVALSLALNACDQAPPAEDTKGDNIIGDNSKAMSEVSRKDGTANSKVAFFDETVRRIQLFDLNKAEHIKSYKVRDSGTKHNLLFHQDGNYMIDMSPNQMTIFTPDGDANTNPVSMGGTVVSTAFRPDLGLLILLDDLRNVGILKIDAQGQVAESEVFGSGISATVTISAGELLDDSRLALALSDNTIALVDIEQSLDQHQWTYTTIAPVFPEINWVSTIRGSPNLILVKSKTAIGIIDVNTAGVVTQISLSGYLAEKVSKQIDAHIVLRSDDHNSKEVKVVYADGANLIAKPMYKQEARLISSYLDIGNNTWTFVDATYSYQPYIYNDVNQVRESRVLKRFRYSDMKAEPKMKLPGQAQLQISTNYVFALFPNEMGKATRTDITTKEVRKLTHFNMKGI